MSKSTKTPDDILEEIFSQVPLPNNLKTPKARWKAGELKAGAIVSIIEQHSDFICEIVCRKSTRKSAAK